MSSGIDTDIDAAARAISGADALFITAGAGMGVDSGLPDFRGNTGFWRAYPPMKRLGISFVDMANPAWFSRDPALAWGFYGHRLKLYRRTVPHRGFALLKNWAASMKDGGFVFTSNVDGQFQLAGFARDEVSECHGSINHLQCATPCHEDIWSAAEMEIAVDEECFRAEDPLPTCPRCGSLARPNVLMFGDWHWIPNRCSAQERRLEDWLAKARGERLVIVEIGAGSAVPTVRMTSERVATTTGATLVRINPREAQAPHGQISIPLDALEALQSIDNRLG